MTVTAATLARTIVFALAILNQILAWCGLDIINIPDETINTVVDGLFLIGASVVGFWKNNSFSQPALKADKYMKELKAKSRK